MSAWATCGFAYIFEQLFKGKFYARNLSSNNLAIFSNFLAFQ